MRGIQLSLFDTKHTRMDDLVDESFWAYHAGMADGDGCITSDFTYSLNLVDKNVIEEIANLYKVSITKVKRKNKRHQQMYRCSLYSNNAKHFISRIAPYLIEKRKFTAELCKKFNVEIEKPSTDPNLRFAWLAGYFDAEGHVRMRNNYDERSKNYCFDIRLRFTSTNILVLRFIRRLINKYFNSNGEKSIINLFSKGAIRGNRKKGWDLEISQTAKVHLFAKVFEQMVKIKRKKKTFKRIIDYARFCAWQKWQFGRINFKKNTELRERWLKASEME